MLKKVFDIGGELFYYLIMKTPITAEDLNKLPTGHYKMVLPDGKFEVFYRNTELDFYDKSGIWYSMGNDEPLVSKEIINTWNPVSVEEIK